MHKLFSNLKGFHNCEFACESLELEKDISDIIYSEPAYSYGYGYGNSIGCGDGKGDSYSYSYGDGWDYGQVNSYGDGRTMYNILTLFFGMSNA